LQHRRDRALVTLAHPARIAAIGVLLGMAALDAVAQQPWEIGELPPEPERPPSALNVSITLFEPGVPENRALHREQEVFPRIRTIESLFLPFVLREAIHESGEWGAVRVIRGTQSSAELLVSCEIVRSDGNTLTIDLEAVDAAGRVWIDRLYSGVVTERYSLDDDQAGVPELFRQIAAELVVVRDSLDERSLDNIAELSLMRYAIDLLPGPFEDYVVEAPDGLFSLNRLPARDDPTLARIHRLRRVENAITDVVDERYDELHGEIASVYDLWRQYRRKFKQFQDDEAVRARIDPSDAPKGSYDAMMDRYERYKWDRMAAQEQDKWAVGFDNEVGPTIDTIESRIETLAGWVDLEYANWQRILAEFYEIENRLAPEAAGPE